MVQLTANDDRSGFGILNETAPFVQLAAQMRLHRHCPRSVNE
jgi:hypothetical protein